jgi:uncharacterized FAD-dependent dehydrogenase
MALIILEGLDRTGKSSVARHFEEKEGYEVIHLSAPRKGITSDEYLQEMVDLISSAAGKNIVLDRSHYGELIWPSVYNRKPVLSEEEIEIIREIEETVGVQRILMHDKDAEAHWKRCVANKEPLTKAQFLRARSLYSSIGHKYGFQSLTLPEFTGKTVEELAKSEKDANDLQGVSQAETVTPDSSVQPAEKVESGGALNAHLSKEQRQLEAANAINEVLSKKILKQKGDHFDTIEKEIRNFLNAKLAKLLGTNQEDVLLTAEETRFYKAMYKRAIEKENK